MADDVEIEPFPFATVEDLKKRWPDMPPGSDDHAEVLLEDASALIMEAFPRVHEASEATRRRIVCAMVKRSMKAGLDDRDGVSSVSETTGPFQVSHSFSNPNGDLFLTKQERQALGGGKQRAGSVDLLDADYLAPGPFPLSPDTWHPWSGF